VWKGSTKLGCGMGSYHNTSDPDPVQQFLWVCRYCGAGNIDKSQLKQNVLLPIKTAAECNGKSSDVPSNWKITPVKAPDPASNPATKKSSDTALNDKSAAAAQTVYSSLVIAGMDYSRLTGKPAMLLQVKGSIKKRAASALKCDLSAVNVVLYSGSINAQLEIQAPAGTTKFAVSKLLISKTAAIAKSVVVDLRKVPGVEAVLSGGMSDLTVKFGLTTTDKAAAVADRAARAAAAVSAVTAAAAQKPAYQSLYISGMDYGLLQARRVVRSLVVGTIKAGAAYGQSYNGSAVGVELSSGSTIAHLVIQVPAGTTAVALMQQLTTTCPAIANSVLQLLLQVRGINSVLTGVLNVQCGGTSTERAPTVPVTAPVVSAMAPAPSASMPFDLNAAMVSDIESSIESAGHGQWSTVLTISLVGLVASVAGVSYALSKRKPPTIVDEEVVLVECVEE